MKTILMLFTVLLSTTLIHAQNISDCDINGDDSRWESQWAFPGTAATIHTMIEGPDGNIWASGSGNSGWGGDTELNGLVNWDGERWAQIGGRFRCTSCGQGTRYAMRMDQNGAVFIGGFFEGAENYDGTYVASSGLIKWNTTSETWESLGDILNADGSRGTVYSMAIDTQANILYVGGEFERVTSTDGTMTEVSNIAALDMNTQVWSNMNGGVLNTITYIDGIVYALEVGTNNILYVGGGFSEVDGQNVYGIAQWHPSNGWATVGQGLPDINVNNGMIFYSTVYSLVYDAMAEVLYAGGVFGELSGSGQTQLDRSLAVFQNDSWTLISGIGRPFNQSSSRVRALTINPTNGHLFVGGTFTKHVGNNSPVANLVGEWNPQTAEWDDLNDGLLSSSVNGLVFKNNTLFVGGGFNSHSGGLQSNNFAIWDGNNWDNVGNGLNNIFSEVEDISFTSDGFIISGNFTEVDELELAGIARWRDASGWEAVPFSVYGTSASNFASLIYATHLEGDWLYVGGFFGGVNGTTETKGLAAYNLSTGETKTWGTGLDGLFFKVNDITTFQGDIYIAGRFTGIDGQEMNNIARLDPVTDTWEAIGTLNNEVFQLHNAADNQLLVSGSFTNIDGNNDLKRVAVYDGNNWSGVGAGIQNGNVNAICYLPESNSILIGGTFTQAVQSDGTSLTARRLAIFKNGQWEDLNTLTGDNDFLSVQQLYYDEATKLVYIGGDFKIVGQQTINHIFRLEPESGIFADLGSGLDRLDESLNLETTVNFIGRQGDQLVLGGDFNSAGLNQANGITVYNLEDFIGDLNSISTQLPDSTSSCISTILDTGTDDFFYEWSTGEESTTIEVETSGTYSVTITSLNGCSNSDTINVTIFPEPEITFNGGLTDTLVTCDSILVNPDGNFVEYSWNEGASFDSVYVAMNSDWIILEAQDGNNCVGNDSIFVNINQSPGADFTFEIIEDTVYLFVINPNNDFSYNWDFGDNNNAEGIDPIHVYTSPGDYDIQLIVSSATCGETEFSQTVTIDITNAFEDVFRPTAFNAFPNPTNDEITLSWESQSPEAIRIEVLDINGRLLESKIHLSDLYNQYSINLNNYPNGIYFCRMTTSEGSFEFKMEKF